MCGAQSKNIAMGYSNWHYVYINYCTSRKKSTPKQTFTTMGISFFERGVGMWQMHIDPLDNRWLGILGYCLE
jgi:hypothetical protein